MLIRESETALPYFPMPLTGPSVQAAMEFLQWVIPGTVLSAGSGRRRRRGDLRQAEGRRSDQGYPLFYWQSDESSAPHIRPLKALPSIEAYLQEKVNGELAEHWVATQITQYRAGRDGVTLAGGFSATTARHILNIVADLDGKRMDPMLRRLLIEDWWAFLEALNARLSTVGIERYLVVRSGPGGVHVYVPLLRPDGRPLRASEKNLAVWDLAAKGLNRLLEDCGADANAVKPTQPFAIVGVPRAKHPGFVPYVAARRDGKATDLFQLIKRMSELKLMPASRPAEVIALPTAEAGDRAAALLEEIRTEAAGVSHGGRNKAAHDIAVYLLCKGIPVRETETALKEWNERNDPPLSRKELRRCIRSAERRAQNRDQQWSEMKAAPWRRLRGDLGLATPRMAGYTRAGRWRPLTPRRAWEDRKQDGGREHYFEVAERVLRFVAGEGGLVTMKQADLASLIDTNRSTLQAVLASLKASGRLLVTTTRGRCGKTVLEMPEPSGSGLSDKVTENDSSRISPEGVQMGAWVGPAGSLPVGPLVEAAPVGSVAEPAPAGDVHSALASVAHAVIGLDERAYQPGWVLVVVSAVGGWLVVARNQVGGDLLHAVDVAGGRAMLAQMLGADVRFVYGSGRDPRRPGGGSRWSG
ncbi:MAG TPA: primase C-terminal domain-containing protein [Symbiobacteriaceae bacterium]|nr:primase C-terminal domain-containing protein [Symbiobacteriaceae bacterium]